MRSFVALLYKIRNLPTFPQYVNASLVFPPDLSRPGIHIKNLSGPVLSIVQYILGDVGPEAGIVGFGSTFAIKFINTGVLHFASAAVTFPAFAASAAVFAAVAFVFASVADVFAAEATGAVVAPSADDFAAFAAVVANSASVLAVFAAATDGPPIAIASSAMLTALAAIVNASVANDIADVFVSVRILASAEALAAIAAAFAALAAAFALSAAVFAAFAASTV